MIYTIDEIKNPGSIFAGWGNTPHFHYSNWSSNLPSLDVQQFFRTDASFNAQLEGMNYTEELGRISVLSGLRNCMAQLSRTWGYFQTATGYIQDIFDEDVVDVSRVIEGLEKMFDSEALNKAINAIGWVPVVGWIIKIVYEVAKIITSIIRAVREAKTKKLINELRSEFSLPIVQPTPEADTVLGRFLQRKLMDDKADFQWVAMPSYPARSPNDFVNVKMKYDTDEPCTNAWLIRGRNELLVPGDDGSSPGLGFVPGTMNIHSSMQLPIGKGGILDMGTFYPLTQSMAGSLWSQAVQGDTGLTFAIDCDHVADAWIDYVQAITEYAYDEVRKGWSKMEGKISDDGRKFKCGPCDIGKGGCTYKDRDQGDWMSNPGSGHYDPMMRYLKELFDWSYLNTSSGGQPADIDFEDITPVRSLDVLKERQSAMIDSVKCMYLDDSSGRFNAIEGALGTQWRANVQAMFDSGDWDRIDYRDVVPGEDVDQALHTMLANMGTDPRDFFNMDLAPDNPKRGKKSWGSGMKVAAGPSVLGDPVPPDMPDPTNYDQLGEVTRRPGPGSGSKGGGGGAAAVLAVAAAALVLKSKK